MTAMTFHRRGSQARLKAQNRLKRGAVASGACRAGVRGFESHPLHQCILLRSFKRAKGQRFPKIRHYLFLVHFIPSGNSEWRQN